ncbi:ornithine cyclodeaminase family protein [Actinophytocola sp. NPDC049390]|uniref:ornithine cyclodeaminase family protein n=1 Tax=Actinophytocola sp. NPDC049390 TaxID=3363894 RepID=UPI00379A7C1F
MLPFLDHHQVMALTYAGAVQALRDALLAGLDVDADPARTVVPVPAGQLLLMPSSGARYTGVKLATVAHEGTPRIKGVYVLMDAATLTPLALLDGPALTTLRTPAVSALAVDLLAPTTPARLVVFGRGPQAHGHVTATRAVREVTGVTFLGRGDDPAPVAEADIVCCATTARTPLFPARLVRPGATVVAVGSHEPDARELPAELMRTVVVESVPTALREAGDVILAGTTDLIPLASVVRHEITVPDDRPRVFKSVGMAWEDLAVAAAVYEAQAS